MPRGSLICEMRATTRRFTGLKISMVLVPGRLITTCPLAIVTSLKPGLPGRSIRATWRSLAARPYTEQLRIVIARSALIFRMGDRDLPSAYWDASSSCSDAQKAFCEIPSGARDPYPSEYAPYHKE